MTRSREELREPLDDSNPSQMKGIESTVRVKTAMFESLSRSGSMSPTPVTSWRVSPPQPSFQVSNLVKSRHDWLKRQSYTRSSSIVPTPGRRGQDNAECRHDTANKRKTWLSRKIETRDAAETSKSVSTMPVMEQNESGNSVHSPGSYGHSNDFSRIRTTPELVSSLRTSQKESESFLRQVVSESEPSVEDSTHEDQKVAYFIKHHRSLTRVTVVENTRTSPTTAVRPRPSRETLSPRSLGTPKASPFRDPSRPYAAGKRSSDDDPRRLHVVTTLSSDDEWKLVRVDSAVCPRTHPVTSFAEKCWDLQFCSILWGT